MSRHQQQLHFSRVSSSSIELGSDELLPAESQPSYSKILEWSFAKLTVQNTNSRRRSSIDLRRSVLIAATVTKARAGILHQKAMEFLEARPQLQPPTGYHPHNHQQSYHQYQQQYKPQPSLNLTPLTIPEVHQDADMEEDDYQHQLGSAFGYSATLLTDDDCDQDQEHQEEEDDDQLSASAEAIVMSAVEVSLEGQAQQSSIQRRPRQLPSVAASSYLVACRQQASQLNGALVPWQLPECHLFA